MLLSQNIRDTEEYILNKASSPFGPSYEIDVRMMRLFSNGLKLDRERDDH